MLDQIKLLLGITDNSKDEIITLLIDMATNEAINYTHNDDISRCTNVIMEMVIWRYGHLGVEGLTSEDYSGVSFSYQSNYPSTILKQLNNHRKVITL